MSLVNAFLRTFVCNENAWLNVLCCYLCYEKSKDEVTKAHRVLKNKQNERRRRELREQNNKMLPKLPSQVALNTMRPAQGII